jgi:hypothetical protein
MDVKKTCQAINNFELGVKVVAAGSALLLATCELTKAIIGWKAKH